MATTRSIQSVTVYCASSRHVAQDYFTAAAELGTAIATVGWQLIYGGNHVGCMGALADAARMAGGRVVGITPQLLVSDGIADHSCDELIVTRGMRERKALLEEKGDAFIALPGGLGTFEEVFEIIVSKLLKYHQKPIVLLNVQDYYAPLLAMIDHGIEQRFIKPAAKEAYFVAKSIPEMLQYLQQPVRRGLPATDPSAAE